MSFTLGSVISSLLLSRFEFLKQSISAFVYWYSKNYMELFPARRVNIMKSEKVANCKQQIDDFWLTLKEIVLKDRLFYSCVLSNLAYDYKELTLL